MAAAQTEISRLRSLAEDLDRRLVTSEAEAHIARQELAQLRADRAASAVDRDAIVACIRDASDRAFEAGLKGDAHFRFGDIIARADRLLIKSKPDQTR